MGVSVDASDEGDPPDTARRSCGECSLCCTVLRVDELRKLGGIPCTELRDDGGCSIYDRRPGICRAYRCLWLKGGFEEEDRPDRLGAVVDILTTGGSTRLGIQEARPGAFDASPRLREIAQLYRETMPVRIVEAGNVTDPDRPFRLLLANGEEQRVRGEWIDVYRNGERVAQRRFPWLQRQLRRLGVALRARRLRDFPRSG
jgi:Fe-S-cluster containining protein